MTIKGSNATLVGSKSAKVTVRGANNLVRMTKLPILKIIGANNTAVVKKGTTKVTVRGANNSVRVNKRR